MRYVSHRLPARTESGPSRSAATRPGGGHMLFRKLTLPEYDIHHVLSNPRRCEALEHITASAEPIALRELSEVVATAESDQSPAPRAVREAVYVSLHQHHLPALHRRGIVNYDRDRKLIEPLAGARDVELYMEVVTRHGITWAEYYRLLGVVGLLLVVVSFLDVPLVSQVPTLVWASGFLAVFAVSTAYQFWKNRRAVVRSFTRQTGRDRGRGPR